MAKENPKIIGINPGTRYLGIAVLYGSELMDWRIKTLDGRQSKEKINKVKGIMNEYIDLYKLNILAIKKLYSSRRSENLLCLVNKIKELSKIIQLRVHQYSIKEIEWSFIESDKLNKQNLINAMVKLYPVLHCDLKNEQGLKNPYYFRMFEAVALASAQGLG